MQLKDNNINNVIKGMKNILLNDTWNENAVKFWNNLCYINTSNLLGYSTENINICYQKIKIENCYINLLNFTNKALYNIKNKIKNQEMDYYNVIQDNNDINISLNIKELEERFTNLLEEIIN